MHPDFAIKIAVYRHFAMTGRRPSADEIAGEALTDTASVVEAWRRLQAERVLFLDPVDGEIRMAPPFSGVETQHVVESGGITYHANCAWDALGIPAALGRAAVVHSRCGQSGEPLRMEVGGAGPPPSNWLYHCLVPAAQWWADIVYT